jgi:hypothetical protein
MPDESKAFCVMGVSNFKTKSPENSRFSGLFV